MGIVLQLFIYYLDRRGGEIQVCAFHLHGQEHTDLGTVALACGESHLNVFPQKVQCSFHVSKSLGKFDNIPWRDGKLIVAVSCQHQLRDSDLPHAVGLAEETEQGIQRQEEILHRLDALLSLGPFHDGGAERERTLESFGSDVSFRLALHLLPELLPVGRGAGAAEIDEGHPLLVGHNVGKVQGNKSVPSPTYPVAPVKIIFIFLYGYYSSYWVQSYSFLVNSEDFWLTLHLN